MNLLSPSETSDIVASVIAARGAPPPVCGSCCDWDCCGALGCSWAESRTTGARRSATNTEIASLVVIRLDVEVCCPQTAGRIVGGQALRLPRQAKRLPYNSIRRKRNAFAITVTELKLIAAPAIIGLRRTPKN